jgi:type VI secretion system protein ImpA
MASPETLDFERLLKPISAQQPAGAEMKEDPALSTKYFKVKDAREAARGAERKQAQAISAGEPESGGDAPNWRQVFDLTTAAIADNSKDLWIAAWLIEALVRLHGFAGLRDGFRLVRELSETYWDNIHPRPDDEGYATTVAQLTGLNGDDSQGALIAPISDIPLTDSPTYGKLTSADHLDALELEQVADPQKRALRIEQGVNTLELLDKAAADTPVEFFRQSLDDLDQAIAEFGRMTVVLGEKCGKDASGYSLAPPSSNLANALSACRERLVSLSRHVLASESETGADGQLGPATVGGSLVVDKSRMPTREDAFRSLLQVADFFRRTEPHSPVSYALEQAVRWGRMPLPELLQELIMDDTVRKDLFRRTGIGPVDSGAS